MVPRQLSEHQREIADALSDVRAEIGEPIKVYRDSQLIARISKAVRGSSEWSAETTRSEVALKNVTVDFLIDRDDYIDREGRRTTPTRGDEIHDQNGTVYRVMPAGRNTDVWRWVDRGGKTVMRVHTKEV